MGDYSGNVFRIGEALPVPSLSPIGIALLWIALGFAWRRRLGP
jgi:hypothetical protein